MPGIVGNTQSPGELLVTEKMNLKDSGVIAFGENGKYFFLFENIAASISRKNIMCFMSISIGFLLIPCNTNPNIKNKNTSIISPEFNKFVQRFWCRSEKSSEDQWDNGIKNLLKNLLQVEIQKRANKL